MQTVIVVYILTSYWRDKKFDENQAIWNRICLSESTFLGLAGIQIKYLYTRV